MCIRIKHIIVGLTFLNVSLALVHAAGHLEAEIEQLRAINTVTGNAVGCAMVPGEFFKLSKIFVQKGTEKDFLKLTSDENPVVKCMGLLCLAQHKKSIGVLKEHLSDQDIVRHQTGCVAQSVTVGHVAGNLLHNANYLDADYFEFRCESLPVLSEDGLVGLDIEILARDSTIGSHYGSGAALFGVFVRGRVALRLSDLSEYAPHLETYEIIKAIGRVGASHVGQSKWLVRETKWALQMGQTPGRVQLPEPAETANAHREFLISCLEDKKLDQASRLAAASALTRDTSDAAMEAIERQRSYLNQVAGQAWGDIFAETCRNRRTHEKRLGVVRERLLRASNEEMKTAYIALYSNSHPLALADLESSFTGSLRDKDYGESYREAVRASLLEMSGNLRKYGQPWNTYSDTAQRLQHMVNMWGERDMFEQMFTDAERLEFERNIRNAIREDFVK